MLTIKIGMKIEKHKGEVKDELKLYNNLQQCKRFRTMPPTSVSAAQQQPLGFGLLVGLTHTYMHA